MANDSLYDALIRTYTNPTKMSILFLLAGNEKMTVTTMAKYVNVSRSNLYHYVSQLVDDGLLNEPEVVPRKNYVEKYYTLNRETFKSIDAREYTKRMKTLDSSEMKAPISSTLIAHSVQLMLAAENVSKAGPKLLKIVSEWMLAYPYSMTFSTLNASSVDIAYSHIEGMYQEMTTKNQKEEDLQSQEIGLLAISLLPIEISRPTDE